MEDLCFKKKNQKNLESLLIGDADVFDPSYRAEQYHEKNFDIIGNINAFHHSNLFLKLRRSIHIARSNLSTSRKYFMNVRQ
jgi:hypothetical protein